FCPLGTIAGRGDGDRAGACPSASLAGGLPTDPRFATRIWRGGASSDSDPAVRAAQSPVLASVGRAWLRPVFGRRSSRRAARGLVRSPVLLAGFGTARWLHRDRREEASGGALFRAALQSGARMCRSRIHPNQSRLPCRQEQDTADPDR